MTLRMIDAHPTDQLFTHIEPDGSKVRTINVSWLMRQYRLGNLPAEQVIEVQVTKQQADWCIQNNGVEMPHVTSLRGPQDEPIVLARFNTPNGDEYVIIDGNHRFVYHYMQGRTHCPAVVFAPEVWEKALVIDAVYPPGFLDQIKTQGAM